MKITVSGASDDLIEIGGDMDKEFPVGDITARGLPLTIWRGDWIAPNGEQARTYVMYDGCWHVSVGRVDEDVPFPDWNWTFVAGDRDYVTSLEFDPPDGTRLTNTTTEE